MLKTVHDSHSGVGSRPAHYKSRFTLKGNKQSYSSIGFTLIFICYSMKALHLLVVVFTRIADLFVQQEAVGI